MLYEVLCSSFLWNTFEAREMELVSSSVGRRKITEMLCVCVCVCGMFVSRCWGAAVESTVQATGCCS